MSKVEEFYRKWGSVCRIYKKEPRIHSHAVMLQFAKEYHEDSMQINETKRFSRDEVIRLMEYLDRSKNSEDFETYGDELEEFLKSENIKDLPYDTIAILSDDGMSETLDSIEQKCQSQGSLTYQIALLRIFANKLGLYDACDFLRPKSL